MKDEKEKTPVLVELDFQHGDFVALRIDPEGKVGMVTGIAFRPYGMRYAVTFEKGEQDHFACELRAADEPKPEPAV